MAELAKLRPLCRVAEVADGASLGFPPAPGAFTGLFAVRAGAALRVYVNACPHLGVPLDWAPGRFLSADRSHIVCATHGARFRIEDGECFHGPCYGARLEPVMIEIKDGTLYVPADAGL
ncbi:MAG TPA: Rieske 2Fe-2S domain-containing protein [Acetobacteraceae bacterium]|nr:Rieske 2Fe-2S domain-containing protein [Acetobacteraceae bacterium]